jgi:hypothetical protein
MNTQKKTELEISDFLYNLENSPPSHEKRIFASQFIAENRDSIDGYVERYGTSEYARKLKRIVDQHRVPVRGECVNMSTATYSYMYTNSTPQIRSFRMTTKKDYSMTFATVHSIARGVGYLVAAGIVAGILYSGYKLKKEIIENPNHPIVMWVEKIQNMYQGDFKDLDSRE